MAFSTRVTAIVVAASVTGLGCGSTSMATVGPKEPARAATCDFSLFTALPSEGYHEVGTIDVNPGWSGIHTYTSLASFKDEIRPHVCEAGGDAALAVANGFGMYIKATILKSSARTADASAPASGGVAPAAQ